MKALLVRFGVWLLRPVVYQLAEELSAKQTEEAMPVVRQWLEDMTERMRLPKERAVHEEK